MQFEAVNGNMNVLLLLKRSSFVHGTRKYLSIFHEPAQVLYSWHDEEVSEVEDADYFVSKQGGRCQIHATMFYIELKGVLPDLCELYHKLSKDSHPSFARLKSCIWGRACLGPSERWNWKIFDILAMAHATRSNGTKGRVYDRRPD